ncbi:MaoC family dehydratase [Pseudonocardia sp. HH130630-07]|uniref:MaoC family dehydratase n=1 Tax=Pseudonocardia sp. HH130630-07 TaxID=1690815 RepID=UPI000814B7C2|nr:MaoC family dehydratase [Pseudonocardia sp. HH130630-07]ANY08436.1 dehydratase [Pseudonocardia sp. HH130630-07]
MTWRDLTDPRVVADGVDPEAGLKEPVFENLDIPEALGPVTLVVDDHKIKRYAFTQDDHHPWHLHDSPFGGRIAHAGLLSNDLVQLFTTRYAASRTVGLHTEEQLWFDSPAFLGDEVTLSGTYVESYTRRGQDYVVMEAAATGPDGRSVLRHRGVEILRTRPGDVAGRGATGSSGSGRVSGTADPGLPTAVPGTPTVRPGAALPGLEVTITQEQASVFSRTGEYVRNVHSDLDVARAGGLRIPIVQGQQQCGLVTAMLTRFFGTALFGGGWLRVKFVAPVEVFEPLRVGGVVTEVTPAGDGGTTIAAEVWVRRADGRLSTVGWASATVPAA